MTVLKLLPSWELRLHWIQKGGLAILDQGLFSGANFLANILLARWLPPEEYGAFAVALSVFHLLASLHTAVLTEPMMVFGAGKYRDRFREYLGIVLYGHWVVSIMIALLLGIAALTIKNLGSPSMAHALAGLALASPFLLLFWLSRRGCYVYSYPLWGVIGSAVNLVVMLIGLFTLWQVELLFSLSGLLLLGIGAGIASLSLLRFLCPRLVNPIGNLMSTEIVKDHWKYGSWNLIATGIYWASGYTINFLVPIFLGLKAAALLQVVSALFSPLNLILQSSSLMILPSLASLRERRISIARRTFTIGLLLSAICLLYSVLVTTFYESIAVPVLFEGKYTGGYVCAIFLGLHYAVSSLVSTVTLAIKAYGDTRASSFAWGITAVVFSTLAIPSLIFGKLIGVLIIWIIATIAALPWAIRALNKLEGRESGFPQTLQVSL